MKNSVPGIDIDDAKRLATPLTTRGSARKTPVSLVEVLDQNGCTVSNCSLSRAMALLEKGAAEVARVDPMTIKLTRPMGNGAPPCPPRPQGPVTPGQKRREARVRSLRARDGNNCFYCGVELGKGEATLEHLLSEKDGGSSRQANLALAHKKCNELAADLPIVDKVMLRERLHATRSGALLRADMTELGVGPFSAPARDVLHN
jgi:hypothetical protein